MSLYGTIIAISHSTVPTGYLLCNGSAVSRTTYSALFSTLGTLYGEGDGSSTFNLPNLVGRFLEGNSSAGTSKAAGLPEISGTANGVASVGTSASGAFYYTGASACEVRGSYNGHYVSTHNFSASRSNVIYGASTTVQPPSVTTLYCIKY